MGPSVKVPSGTRKQYRPGKSLGTPSTSRVQDTEIPRRKKFDKKGKRLAWLSQDVLVKLKGKKETHGQWKQKHVSCVLERVQGYSLAV